MVEDIKKIKHGIQVDEIKFQFDKDKTIQCPDCGGTMRKVYITNGDLPLFAGYGSCKCEHP